jgi:hypothetical protein
MKELLIYTALFLALLVAIVIPLDAGFWWGLVRGGCLGIAINLIPKWVEVRRNE